MFKWFVLYLGFLFAVTGTGPSQAHTWFVEGNGTGDFEVIQDAINASASGDTIRIGAGRYDDFHWLVFGNNGYYLRVEDKDLVFLGAGCEETIIGHLDPPFADHIVVNGIQVRGSEIVFRMQDIGIENIRLGDAISHYSGRIELDNCRIQHCSDGILATLPQGGWVRDCRFVDVGYWPGNALGAGINFNQPSVGVEIERCEFTDCFKGIGCYWSGTSGIEIKDCSFNGGRTGVAFVDGAFGHVKNCRFESQEWYGVLGAYSGGGVLEDNEIIVNHPNGEAYGFCVYWWPSDFSLYRNKISASNGNLCFQLVVPNLVLEAKDNHFIRSDEVSLYCAATNAAIGGDPIEIDVTGNWWGTADSSEIAQGIVDGHGDPDLNYFIVYEPFLDSPVEIKKKPIGGFKSMFR